ncbi:MAG: hypothetical protein KDK90_28505 [Leptospiraceae bacterium]|nr:hypothetical protein [Leptospiraceae bacterium]
MKVEVTIMVSTPASEKDLKSLQNAGYRLTNNKKSVKVKTIKKDNHFLLISTFDIKTTAQYEVVDIISKEFKFWTFDLEGVQDIAISFDK